MMQLGVHFADFADFAVEPRPPVLIGGAGEKKTPRLVARRRGPDVRPRRGRAAGKLCTLARHCEAEGSDPATIRTTILGGGDPDGFLRGMEGYAKLGVDLVEVMPVTSDLVGFVARLGGAIVPRLAQIPLTDVAGSAPRPREPRTTRPGIKRAFISASGPGTVGHTSHSQLPQQAAGRSR
jgi:hypothetical protein